MDEEDDVHSEHFYHNNDDVITQIVAKANYIQRSQNWEHLFEKGWVAMVCSVKKRIKSQINTIIVLYRSNS